MAGAKRATAVTTNKRGRGRPLVPAISPQQVVEEALSIIDAEGLAALNMRRLATQLGVNAPSLYHYFPNKEAILLAVAQRAIGSMPAQKPTDEAWVDYFVRVMKEYRRVLLAHPNLVGLMAHLRLASLISDSTFEHGATAMADSGIPPELMLTITEAAEALVFGWVFSKEADRQMREVPADGTARRKLAEANALSEDQRFELACYSLTNGFLASVMLSGPRNWQGGNGKRKQSTTRHQRT